MEYLDNSLHEQEQHFEEWQEQHHEDEQEHHHGVELATDNLFSGFLRDPKVVFLEGDFLTEALVVDLAVIGFISGVAGEIGSILVISGFAVFSSFSVLGVFVFFLAGSWITKASGV